MSCDHTTVVKQCLRNNNNNPIWRGSTLTGEEPSTPLWGGEACSPPSRRPNPIPAVPPYVVRTHISMEHRLRKKHLQLNAETCPPRPKNQIFTNENRHFFATGTFRLFFLQRPKKERKIDEKKKKNMKKCEKKRKKGNEKCKIDKKNKNEKSLNISEVLGFTRKNLRPFRGFVVVVEKFFRRSPRRFSSFSGMCLFPKKSNNQFWEFSPFFR